MTEQSTNSFECSSLERQRRINDICNRFEQEWKAGRRPQIEPFLVEVPSKDWVRLLEELVLLEMEYRRLAGESPSVSEYLLRFGELDRNRLESPTTLPVVPEAPSATLRLPDCLGDYRLFEELGRGGMGVVHRAEHLPTSRTVAVKVLHPCQSGDVHWRDRFVREVETARRLQHPNLVRAIDSGESNGHVFLVTEYIEGRNLAGIVRESGPFTVGTTLEFVSRIADALDYAHREGVVHRDVKPSNMMLDRTGIVRLLDLGLVRLVESASSASPGEHANLTDEDSLLGTIDYMAPEQAINARRAGPRSDIYSLGCSLYFLLTGSPPYPADTLEGRLLAHRFGLIPSLSESCSSADPSLDRLLERMMAKQPEDRFDSMEEVLSEVRGLNL